MVLRFLNSYGLMVLALISLMAEISKPVHAMENGKIKVVTSFTILADMTRNVAGDRATVISVTKPGAEIHGYQPTPQDLVKASNADLVLWNGLGLERWFEKFLTHLDEVPSAVLTTGIDPIPISSGNYAGRPNPHAWMGSAEAMIYIDNIRQALTNADPEGAATYARNAKQYKAALSALINPLRESVSAIPEKSRMLVTCEGAFSYLARDLGMEEMYIWPINADQIGTPQQVRRVIDAVRNSNVTAVFCESTVSIDPAEQIARETNARFGGVLYVDSLSRADGPVPTYLDLMEKTVNTISTALNDSKL